MNEILEILKARAEEAGGPFTDIVIEDLAEMIGNSRNETRFKLQELQRRGKIACQCHRIDKQKYDRRFFIKVL